MSMALPHVSFMNYLCIDNITYQPDNEYLNKLNDIYQNIE